MDQLVGDVVPAERRRLAAQLLDQVQRLRELLAIRLATSAASAGVSTWTATQGAFRLAAMRRVARTNRPEKGLGPTHTSSRSRAGQCPPRACSSR